MRRVLVLIVAIVILGTWFALPLRASKPTEHHIAIGAQRFAFEPAVIHVRRGDHVYLELEALDVSHGIYIDGYEVAATANVGRSVRIQFVAHRAGTFRYRCSVSCGNMHPFMIGELVVEPNNLFPLSIALILAATMGSLVIIWRRPALLATEGNGSGWRLPLSDFPLVQRLLRWRGLQPGLLLPALFFFVLVILTGLLGTPVGNKNLAIILVWIVWWAMLMIVLVPLTGRLWCAMCPIPGPGEWLQRRGIVIKRGGRPLSLALRWPRQLDNIWLQNLVFLSVAVFSAQILTLPAVTGGLLLGFIVVAVVLGLLFKGRVFCRYVCPVGGFIGLYSLLAPLELRVRNVEVCRTHHAKECYLGSEQGHGCPWLVRPWQLQRNASCGLCTECIKTCPKDNIVLQVRPFGVDLKAPEGGGLDEAFKAMIMLTCALLYSAIFLGPWAWLKDWAGSPALASRVSYAAAVLGANVIVVPGLFLLLVMLSRRLSGVTGLPLKQQFIDYAYALVPLGLSVWVAFSLSFLLINGSYVFAVASDPFGWGWDLFGTRSYAWTPVLTGAISYFQIAVLIGGLIWSIRIAAKIGRRNKPDGSMVFHLLPVVGFLVLYTICVVALYVL